MHKSCSRLRDQGGGAALALIAIGGIVVALGVLAASIERLGVLVPAVYASVAQTTH